MPAVNVEVGPRLASGIARVRDRDLGLRAEQEELRRSRSVTVSLRPSALRPMLGNTLRVASKGSAGNKLP